MMPVLPNNMNDDLLVKYLLGEASAAEAHAVESWIAVDPAHARHAAEYRRLLEASQQLAQRSDADPDAAWERFRARTAARKPATPVRRFSWVRIAAMLLVAVGIGSIVYRITGTTAPVDLEVVARQEPRTDTLPDGSVITLNRQASLSYPDRFTGDRRSVALRGEAFFSVTPDKKKPFVIQVNDVTVTVVGTSFNVRGQGDSTEVIVETGIVQVTRNGRSVLLHPGEQVTVRKTDSTLSKAASPDALHQYYRTGAFVCDNTPLWRFVDALNEAYGARILIDRPGLRELPLTSTFKEASLDEVLEVLRITFNLTVSRENGTIHLR